MHNVLLTLQVIVSIFLVLAILLQQRGAGLGAALGGGEGNFYATKRGAEKILANATIVLVALFLGLSIGMLFV